jgi:muramoyltetrapeptide carboxypeptidase LdcA involved in peptidoglycan recycling
MFRYAAKPRPGDKVAVLSPAAALPALFPHVFDLGLERLAEQYAVVPVEYPTTRTMSPPAARAADVNAAFADPEITAILTSIGGQDEIKILKHLDAGVIAANPKPFFGLSDNSNLHNYLWNLGIVSYYGGAVMVELGRCGSVNPHTAEAFRASFLGEGWYDLRPADTYTDVNLDWADPANLAREPEMFRGAGWQWHGGSGAVEGRLWGGCLEIVDFNLRAARYLAPDDAAYDGCVLYLETSEELPTAQYVGELLMCMGERGLLRRFTALLMGRPKAWSLEHRNGPEERKAFVDAQHEAVLGAMAEYSPDVPVVLDVDVGHTDPQLVLPNGGEVRIDPAAGTISVRY